MVDDLIKINGPGGRKFVFRKSTNAIYANRFFVFPGERDICVALGRAEPFDETEDGKQIIDIISKVIMTKETFLDFTALATRVCEREFSDEKDVDDEPDKHSQVGIENIRPGHAVFLDVERDPKKRN